MRSLKALLLLVVLGFVITGISFAQELPRFQLNYSAGYHHIPGSLFSLGEGVINHPDSLNGMTQNLGAEIRVTKKMYLGAEAFRVIGHGFGRWETKESVADLKDEGIKGTITGNNTMRVDGLEIYVRKYFFVHKRVQPFWKLGGGIGKLRFAFNGALDGVQTDFGIPVHEPAHDGYATTIPIVNAEGGVDFPLSKHLAVSTSGFWNTGYGIKAGLTIRF